jgi:UDP-N-acetyl-D-galactosamine dehydrogenase
MILAGRRINDGMAQWVARDILSVMLKKRIAVGQARILVMGFTFKENVPDIRNSKVADLVRELGEFAGEVVVFDPHADVTEVRDEYGLALTNELPQGPFDGLVIAVGHKLIRDFGRDALGRLLASDRPSFIYDVKWLLPAADVDGRV